MHWITSVYDRIVHKLLNDGRDEPMGLTMGKLFVTKFLLPFVVVIVVFALLFWALKYFDIGQIAGTRDITFYIEAVIFAAVVIALPGFVRALLEQRNRRH